LVTYDGGAHAQVIGGILRVPNVDYSIYKPTNTRNYTGLAGNINYYRRFIDAAGNVGDENTENVIYGSVLTPHDPIYIIGNDNFTSANGVVGGSGMADDPYIIENWDISPGSSSGIEIGNTTAYFVIRNCYVHDGGNLGGD
jgi:hypothetical protein